MSGRTPRRAAFTVLAVMAMALVSPTTLRPVTAGAAACPWMDTRKTADVSLVLVGSSSRDIRVKDPGFDQDLKSCLLGAGTPTSAPAGLPLTSTTMGGAQATAPYVSAGFALAMLTLGIGMTWRRRALSRAASRTSSTAMPSSAVTGGGVPDRRDWTTPT